MTEFEQYLRDNPMPTKTLDNKSYELVEKQCERINSDDGR